MTTLPIHNNAISRSAVNAAINIITTISHSDVTAPFPSFRLVMSKSRTLATPPESFVNPPLTPPQTDTKASKPTKQVSDIIRHVRLREVGHNPSDQPWIVFQFLPGEFEQLIALLKADELLWNFFEHKVRYDYFSRIDRFVLRMPTTTHEFFRSSVVLEIQRQLGVIATGTGEAAEFAKNVRYRGSPRLQFPADEEEMASSKYDAHEPDAAFTHLNAQWPGVVIEVSFSQKKKYLKDLAEDYILGSDGNIRVVIGLDIEYKKSKKATISVWRPQYVECRDGHEDLVSMQTVLDQEFRDDPGNLATDPATGLELQLKDFASKGLIETPDTMNQHVFISSSTLYDFVTCAEAEAKLAKGGEGNMVQLKPGARKRRRQKTPPEELKSDDERRLLEEEERVAKRMAARDGDYVGSSSPADE